jgi:nucleotide-binding universal stress UspA family protein
VFKTIVLALDGSEGSQRAIPVARELARRDDAELVIAYVEERNFGKVGGARRVDEEDMQREVRKQADELAAEGVETRIEVVEVLLGGPAHAIESIAEEAGADLIVLGTRGHSPVAGLLLGSVTQRLLHIAHRPVLAVPNHKS